MVGERAALTTQVRSATVIALDEVSAMVVPAERFTEFLRGHPRAAEVLQRQVAERREEGRIRFTPKMRTTAEQRLAWLLLELARRSGNCQAGVHWPSRMMVRPFISARLFHACIVRGAATR